MRTLVASALLAYANADETSLMQDMVKRSTSAQLSASDGKTNRQDSTAKLLETAVKMIKNGVTPDVITFVDSTNQEINEQVLVAIQNEHNTDQAYIDTLCQDFQSAVEKLEDEAVSIAAQNTASDGAREAHHTCRADEAYSCAVSRRCEEQLRLQWLVVVREEEKMQRIHSEIHDEWCIHPPFFAEIDLWLNHPFDWSKTSPYPELNIPADVGAFRDVSVTYFEEYMAQKIVVEAEWAKYEAKLLECSGYEATLDAKVSECDDAQRDARTSACEHAVANKAAREEFGVEWDRIVRLYNEAREAKTANEADRKAEWETLKIVQCLLDHVHSTVTESIETGAPCPTIDSDPDGVTLAIEDCHIVTRGCQEGSMTAHLCLNWCDPPPIPPLPPVVEPACTPAYIAYEQGSFEEAIQTAYTSRLQTDNAYPGDDLVNYFTTLSPAGWAGCAAPLVCVDCPGIAVAPPMETYTAEARSCHLHEQYLSPGQSNYDSFKCFDGTCTSMSGRCNGVSNCADNSDELGCDASTDVFVPAFLGKGSACPTDFNADVYFQCDNTNCIEKVGLCNGHDNCGDGSDEVHCTTSLTISVESTSGQAITVETLQSHSSVFHDRSYHFDTLGDFTGKTFIQYSNNDKMTDHDHVMTKLRTVEPTTVYVVKQSTNGLPWLSQEGFERISLTGVTFSGQRTTHHKEWNPALLTTDFFDASEVFSKTFAAGTISLPGNGEGDGSFLIFMEKASHAPYHPVLRDQKCPLGHVDRLFRIPAEGSSAITLEECYQHCASTAGCNHFSHGFWSGGHVCQGCTQTTNAQSHDGFIFYDMPGLVHILPVEE